MALAGSSPLKAESDVARHIARAAARLFAERGYDATSVREIVAAAGVTKPTLYYHFGSKEGLAQALLTVPMAALVDRVRSILAGDGPAVDKLRRFFEANFEFMVEDPDRSRFIYALFFGPLANQGLLAEMIRFGESFDAAMAELARQLADSGVVAADRAGAFANACRGAVVVHTVDYLFKGMGPRGCGGAVEELGPGLARRLVDDILGGFGAPGSAWDRGERT